MAVTSAATSYYLTAAADTIPGKILARKILIQQKTGTAGVIDIRQDSTADLYYGTTVSGDTVAISYGGKGQWIKDFTINTIPANVTVIVQVQ